MEPPFDVERAAPWGPYRTPPFDTEQAEPEGFYRIRQWDPYDAEEEKFQEIFEKLGNGFFENYFNVDKDKQVFRRYLQEQQISEDDIELVFRRLAIWGPCLGFQTSFGPRDYSEAVSRLNLRSSKMDFRRLEDRKGSLVDHVQKLFVYFRVGGKLEKSEINVFGDLYPDCDMDTDVGPQQRKMLAQPGVSKLDNVGAFRIGSETYVAVEAGGILESAHSLLWLLDRQRFAVVQEWERGGDAADWIGIDDRFFETDLKVSFALLSGNPFSEEGAVLEDIQVPDFYWTDYHCEEVGIHPEKGILAAPIADVFDRKTLSWKEE